MRKTSGQVGRESCSDFIFDRDRWRRFTAARITRRSRLSRRAGRPPDDNEVLICCSTPRCVQGEDTCGEEFGVILDS